jgi:hypothetical protein
MEFIAHISSIDNPRRAMCGARGDIMLTGPETSYPQCQCCWEAHQAHEARKSVSPWFKSFLAAMDAPEVSSFHKVPAGAPRLPRVDMDGTFLNLRTFLPVPKWAH